MTDKRYLDNLGSLKIDLMLRGIRLDSALEGGELFMGRAGKGVDIILAGDALVNVPCGDEYTMASPYIIKPVDGGRKTDGKYVITDDEGAIQVKATVVAPPAFYSSHTTSGRAFSDIATFHGSYAAITPKPVCELFNKDAECRYCSGGFDKIDANPVIFTVDEVLETAEAILKEGASDIIYLSIGYSDCEDGGVKFLAPYIKAIKKHFRCLVAVEVLPPKSNKWIDETYALGADSVLYNLELFDKELFETICPGLARTIGRDRYIEALQYAANLFPNGTVASHLIVGLEPPGSTRQGIDMLTAMGVVPILPIYRPSPGRALRIEPLTAEIIIPVYRHLYKAVKENEINMLWVRDISVVTTPSEGRALVGEESGGLTSLYEQFYKTKLGAKAAWGLSTLRRKLRVKQSKDPMDSSKN
jgi:hypothetical protein